MGLCPPGAFPSPCPHCRRCCCGPEGPARLLSSGRPEYPGLPGGKKPQLSPQRQSRTAGSGELTQENWPSCRTSASGAPERPLSFGLSLSGRWALLCVGQAWGLGRLVGSARLWGIS